MAESFDPSGQEWNEYLHEKSIGLPPVKEPKVGNTYLFVRRDIRGIIRMSGDNCADIRGRLLARSKLPTSSEYGEWVVGKEESTFYLIQVGDGPRVPATTLYELQNWMDSVDWKQHIPSVDKPGGDPIPRSSLKKGHIYAYRYNNTNRGVVVITRDENSCNARLLAHTVEEPQSSWGVSGPLSNGCAWLIADESGWIAASAQSAKRPAPQARPKGKREVSVDGVTYVDYDGMADPDAFEAYPYYRIRMPDGTFSINERPVALAVSTIDHCFQCGSKQGPFGYKNECFGCHQNTEAHRAETTLHFDAQRTGLSRVRPSRPVVQSHATLWGGVISLRG